MKSKTYSDSSFKSTSSSANESGYSSIGKLIYIPFSFSSATPGPINESISGLLSLEHNSRKKKITFYLVMKL